MITAGFAVTYVAKVSLDISSDVHYYRFYSACCRFDANKLFGQLVQASSEETLSSANLIASKVL